MKLYVLPFALIAVLFLQGCVSYKYTISFADKEYRPLIKGSIGGRGSKVQEFRSLLEAVGYRITEKAK